MEDTLFEGDETFTVNLMGNTPGVMEGILNTVTTITDNEGIENCLLFTQISIWLYFFYCRCYGVCTSHGECF